MHIFFQGITYQSKHIVWSFPEASPSAECCYKLAGEKGPLDHLLINDALAGISGIEIKDGIATVTDVEVFRLQHPFNILLPLEDQKPLQLNLNLVRGPSFFRSEADHSLQMPASSSTSPRSDVAPPPRTPGTPRSPRVHFALTFSSLLAPFHGETLVYDADAELNILSNNEINLRKLSTLQVHSALSINTAIHVIKNVTLYFLRQHQISMAKKLFDQELIPAIQEFQKGQPIPKYVLDYFAQAVRKIMVNSKYNCKDTLFEEYFIQEHEPIPIHSNYEVRAAYARSMLSYLLSLTKGYPLPDTNNPELDMWLKEFKAHLHLDEESIRERSLRTKNWGLIHSILAFLEQSITCSGLMDHGYKPLQFSSILHSGQVHFSLLVAAIKSIHEGKTTLNYALSKLDGDYKLPETSELSLPPVLTPLSTIMFHWYQTALSPEHKVKVKEHGITELIVDTMKSVMPLFFKTTQGDAHSASAKYISHTIRPGDNELYISPPWKKALDDKFTDKTQYLNRNRKDKTKPKKLKMEICRVIKEVLVEQLALMCTEDKQRKEATPSQTHASSSNSFSYSM
ncbi:hypothetical protein Lmor_1012 [Legionella moravica]|uniref:Uncharacterized protein n=1 Tax=Legionella moravica TaxID=39962 RepID=A0A378JVL7_9GAMM|nr:hypothetical protein [Legionella moravica]KTD35565.1 hypothetical protein Lmor_1012 [Legionella moravica]STX62713.1 Uncharacterised protein [Legionella moravica]